MTRYILAFLFLVPPALADSPQVDGATDYSLVAHNKDATTTVYGTGMDWATCQRKKIYTKWPRPEVWTNMGCEH